MRIKKLVEYILTSGLIILISLILTEVLIIFLLTHPRLLQNSQQLLNRFRELYLESARNIIQLDPKFYKYDPELTYLLKPGQFEFENIEFNTKYFVNSQGLRDDEESLIKPEIIVLGDSYSMGWGVDQQETFAQLIEKESGHKVLNAGISSYGTAREMALLDRLDTSSLKYLIIQHNSTDINENAAFYLHGNRMIASSKEEFQIAIDYNKWEKKYYFMKYLNKFMEPIFGGPLLKIRGPQIPKNEDYFNQNGLEFEEIFINVLVNGTKINLHNVKLIIFNIERWNERPGEIFVYNVTQQKNRSGNPDYIKNMILLNVDPFLNQEDFYILDDHIRKSGHKKLATQLLKIIKSKD